MTNDRILTGVITLSGNSPWAQGQSFQTVEQLQAQIATLTAEVERLREALTYAVEKYGQDGGPWNVPSDPGGWIAKARNALMGSNNEE